MGATTFATYQAGTNMNDAYSEACRDALAEYGHDPYNGTISTTRGVCLTRAPLMTEKGAYLHASRDRTAQKWEAALAFAVAPDDRFTMETITVTKKFPTVAPITDWNGKVIGERPVTQYDIQDMAMDWAIAEYGYRIHKVGIKPRVSSKPHITWAEGRGKAAYMVNDRLFQSRKEAAAWAVQVLENTGKAEALIQAVRLYPGSGEVGRVSRETTKAEAVLTVTLASPKPDAKLSGFVFYGLAAC